MPNVIYKNLLIEKIISFLKESKHLDLISHKGLRGSIRESGLGKLLSPLLPLDWDIGSGKVIDSNGNQSSEIDLLIYYKKTFPPIFFSEKLGLFPIESCGFAFEVKTTSTATETRTSIKKFRMLEKLEPLQPHNEFYQGFYIPKPIKVYFALNSDLTNEDEIIRYHKYDPHCLEEPAADVICIVNRGTWVFRYETDTRSSCWEFYKANKAHDEMFIFFGLILNQLSQENELDIREYWINFTELLPNKIYKDNKVVNLS